MSVSVMKAAWHTKTGSSAAKAVLVALADYADDAGVCWPSVASLAEMTELSERAVQKHLRGLESAGFLQCQIRGNRTSRYLIRLSGDVRHVAPKCERGAPPGVNEVHPERGAGVNEVHPERGAGVNEVHLEGERGAPEPSRTPNTLSHSGAGVNEVHPERGAPLSEKPAGPPPLPPEIAAEGAEGPPIPKPGFPSRADVLNYCFAQGWPLERGVAFWLYHDGARSNGDRAIGPHWHWWSALELWVQRDAELGGGLAKGGGLGKGSTPTARGGKPTINDFERSEDWGDEQLKP